LSRSGTEAGDDLDPDDPDDPESRRRGAAQSGRPLKPSTMRWPEPLYGGVVALELIVIAILNLTVTTGKGAPTHSQTTLSLVGLLCAGGFGALLFTRNRMIVSFGAIAAGFFVTLPKVPDRVTVFHLFGLIFPLIYAFVLTQRQRKDSAALQKARAAGGGGGGGGGSGRTAAERRAQAQAERRDRRGRRSKAPEPTGPAPSPRYTPPKPKRPGRK
jgi:hypothetical protein